MESYLNDVSINGNLTVGGSIYSDKDTPWQKPTYQNGWGEFDPNGTYGAIRYRKVQGVVYIQGMMSGGTASSSLPAFTLPRGFRPSNRMIFGVYTAEGTGTQGNRLDILANGQVHPYAAVSVTTGWFSVHAIFIPDY